MASQSQQTTLLFKKNFGVADTKDTNTLSQEAVASRTRIIPSQQIFSQDIPTTVPTDLVKDISFPSIKGQRWYSAANNYIVYYSSIRLSSLVSQESYWYAGATAATPTANILSSAIPNTYGDGTYVYSVNDVNGNPLAAGGTYPWTFDVDGGILKFYATLALASDPPKIQFYRYEGTFGLNAAAAAAGSNLVSTAYLTTTLNSTLQGLGTLGYLSSVNISGYVVTSNINSTVEGLGTAGYISSTGLAPFFSSFSTSIGTNFYSLSAGFSTVSMGNLTTSNTGFISSLTVNTLTVGTGTGWLSFGAIPVDSKPLAWSVVPRRWCPP